MKILLIEDEQEIAHFIINGLKAEHFTVDWAEAGAKGLMWAKVNPYDLAISTSILEITRTASISAKRSAKRAEVSDYHAFGRQRCAYQDRGIEYRRG